MATDTSRGSVIERLGHDLAGRAERWLPSPFLFAILLTYLVYIIGLVATPASATDLVWFWYDGFWGFLEFTMQMTLIVMTGFVIAYHPRVNQLLTKLTQLPSNGTQGVILVGVFAMVLSWFHWGLCLVLGAVLAREMGKTAHRNNIDIHYPLLCVAGYMGMGVTWNWGLSGSAPLLMATPGNEFIEAGVVEDTVPLTATVVHPYALTLTLLSILFVSAMLYLLAPSPERSRGITEYVPEEDLFEAVGDGGEPDADRIAEESEAEPVPAERINNSKILGGIIALTAIGVIGYSLVFGGLEVLDINFVNFAVLFVGLAVFTRPQVYRERFGEAAEAAAGVILLFPFFAGIQGILEGSGLATQLAEAVFAVSTPETFPVVAWVVAAIVNLFAPSGGGEWIILGPSLIEAADRLGVPIGQTIVAYGVGDAHTNLLNPFWAIPLLAITQIKAREMFGYGIVMLLALIPFLTVVLIVVPY